MLDPVSGWPACPGCGRTMDSDFVNSRPGMFVAYCPTDAIIGRFKSCIHFHRHCAFAELAERSPIVLQA